MTLKHFLLLLLVVSSTPISIYAGDEGLDIPLTYLQYGPVVYYGIRFASLQKACDAMPTIPARFLSVPEYCNRTVLVLIPHPGQNPQHPKVLSIIAPQDANIPNTPIKLRNNEATFHIVGPF